MSALRQQEVAPQPQLSLVPWICSSDFTFSLPPKGNQPRGLRRHKTTKQGSAGWQGLSTLGVFPGSELNSTACNFGASIRAKARLFLEERKRLFIF